MWWNGHTGPAPSCSRYRANRLSAEPHGETAISRDMDLPNTGPIALETRREPTHPSLMCGRFLVAPPPIPEAEQLPVQPEHRRLITPAVRKPIADRSPSVTGHRLHGVRTVEGVRSPRRPLDDVIEN